MTAQTTPTARVSRVINATPEEVFTAWTDSDLVARWFAPGSMRTVVDKFDARVGGDFRIEMHNDAEGKCHTVNGRFVELDNPRRLVMTWNWEEADSYESLVTVHIAANTNGTEVTIVHERLRNQDSADHHAMGWNGILENLAQRIASFH